MHFSTSTTALHFKSHLGHSFSHFLPGVVGRKIAMGQCFFEALMKHTFNFNSYETYILETTELSIYIIINRPKSWNRTDTLRIE